MGRKDLGGPLLINSPVRQAIRELDFTRHQDRLWCGVEDFSVQEDYCQKVWDSGHVSFCFMAEGSGSLTIESAAPCKLSDGCVFIRPAKGRHSLNLFAGTRFINAWISVPVWLFEATCQLGLISIDSGPVWNTGPVDYFHSEIESLMLRLSENRESAGHIALRIQELLSEAFALHQAMSENEKIILLAKNILSDNLHKKIRMEDVAVRCKCSYSRFRQFFQKTCGMAPGEFRIMKRIEKARQLLANPETTIKQVAFDLGYPSVQSFSLQFRRFSGKTPGGYRKEVLP